jgi:hypothetical protein
MPLWSARERTRVVDTCCGQHQYFGERAMVLNNRQGGGADDGTPQWIRDPPPKHSARSHCPQTLKLRLNWINAQIYCQRS